MNLVFPAAAAFGLACLGTYYLSRPTTRLPMMDYPNERSLHDRPIPRTGGLALISGIILGTLILLPDSSLRPMVGYLALGWAILVLVSIRDDVKSLGALTRLAAQFAATSVIIPAGLVPESIHIPLLGEQGLGWLAIPLTFLFVVWFANLYNFMDGMDGFAGGMGGFGFAFLAAIAWQDGQQEIAALALVVSAANLGFLVWNFPPARIFMGDTGSIPMGFLAAVFALWLAETGTPILISVLVFAPFVIDATYTLGRRILRREAVWRAHRSHLYQRVVLLGWSHRKTVLSEYFIMLGVGCTALFLNTNQKDIVKLLTVLFWIILFCGSACTIAMWERSSLKKSIE